MDGQRINRISSRGIYILSFLALFTVMTGYLQPPQADEGTAAHIFQLSILLLAPMFLVYFATADWKRPLLNARTLAIPAAALALAFSALFYLEHYYYR